MAAEAFEDTAEGEVSGVVITPGRTQVYVTLMGETEGRLHPLALQGPDVEITMDGERQDKVDVLLLYLLCHRCTAKLYPRVDRYGLATRAEFTTKEGS